MKTECATPLHRTPDNGDCCTLNWEVSQGKWAIDGLRIMNMGLELREPLHQELVGNPMQHCLPIQGDSVCAGKGTGWSQIWNLWAVQFSTDAACGCLCMPPASGIDYRPTEVVPDRTSWLQPCCSWHSQSQGGKDKAGKEVALRFFVQYLVTVPGLFK